MVRIARAGDAPGPGDTRRRSREGSRVAAARVYTEEEFHDPELDKRRSGCLSKYNKR